MTKKIERELDDEARDSFLRSNSSYQTTSAYVDGRDAWNAAAELFRGRIELAEAQLADVLRAWPEDALGRPIDASLIQEMIPKITAADAGVPFCSGCGARLP